MKQKADEVSKRRMQTCPEHCCQVSLYPVKSGLFLKINYGRKSKTMLYLAFFQLQLHRIQLFYTIFSKILAALVLHFSRLRRLRLQFLCKLRSRCNGNCDSASSFGCVLLLRLVLVLLMLLPWRRRRRSIE